MEKTQKDVWQVKGAGGKFLSSKGWSAQHSGNDSSCFVPLHKNGKVVALIVATGDYDDSRNQVEANASEIVAALAAAAPFAAEPTDTRAAFEQWANLNSRQAWQHKDGAYKNTDIQGKWEAWQAAKGEGK